MLEYSSETWALTKAHRKRLEVAHHRWLRRIMLKVKRYIALSGATRHKWKHRKCYYFWTMIDRIEIQTTNLGFSTIQRAGRSCFQDIATTPVNGNDNMAAKTGNTYTCICIRKYDAYNRNSKGRSTVLTTANTTKVCPNKCNMTDTRSCFGANVSILHYFRLWIIVAITCWHFYQTRRVKDAELVVRISTLTVEVLEI